MQKEKQRKINYLVFGAIKIPNKYINKEDFEFINDIKKVNPQDYPRIFTIVKDGMYCYYMDDPDYYYCLLKKHIFEQQLKEINDGIVRIATSKI